MLPDGWTYANLGEIASTVTSGSRDWAQYYSDAGDKFVRMTNLSRDGVRISENGMKYVAIPPNSSDGKRTSLKNGDILISITAELGKIGLVPNGFGTAFINQHLALVRLKNATASSPFVAYALSSRKLNQKLNSLNDAGAKAGLNLSTIRSFPLALPPLPEQKKIAATLSTWDRAIDVTEKLLANSQQQKKNLMQQLLTGRKRLPGFTEKWKKVLLKDIALIKKGQALSSKDLIHGDYPVIAGGKTSPYTHKHFTHENVITVSASGAYAGYVSFHSYKIWASDCSVITSRPENNISFIYFWLSYLQNKIFSLQSGGAQPHIYPRDLELLHIHCPSLPEQQAIAAVLITADKEITAIEAGLSRLRQEKKALMQQLLTGKRRVKVD